MTTGLLLLCLAAGNGIAPAQVPARPLLAESPNGYISQPRADLTFAHAGPLEEYQPQPGDIILSTEDDLVWRTAYLLAGTGRPSHTQLVVDLPGGELGILEAGHGLTPWIRLVSVTEWRQTFPGNAWVRRRLVPLTVEQRLRLTEFALDAANKPYALLTMFGQLTPFRMRGPIRTMFLGKPRGKGHLYTCAELVLEVLVYAGLIPAATTRPGATYPRDLFFDASINPYIHRHPPLRDGWEGPRYWTRHPATPVTNWVTGRTK